MSRSSAPPTATASQAFVAGLNLLDDALTTFAPVFASFRNIAVWCSISP